MRIYFDFADWWIGYYRGPNHHYVCLLPTVVIRWNRRCAHEWAAVTFVYGYWDECTKCGERR